MAKNNLHNSFIEFCKANDYEENHQQIEIINQLDKFIYPKTRIDL